MKSGDGSKGDSSPVENTHRAKGPISPQIRVVICRSNPVAPDPRVEKIARALTDAGYAVRAVGWDRSGSLPRDDTAQGFAIHRLAIRAGFGLGLMNLPQLLRWQWGLWVWLVRHQREYEVIHACDFDTILPALWVKRWFKKRVVYDIFDFYADHLRRTPLKIKNRIRAADYRAINTADAVILVDDSRRQQISGTVPQRLEVIYNSPEDTRSSLPPYQPTSPGLRLAYIGLLQVERGLLEMLQLLRLHPDWALDLAGFGGDQELILEAARSLPNVTWHGRVSYQRALELSQQADVLFATYDPRIPNHRFSSPNKIFEAMMLGKPVIVARDTNMDVIAEQAGCGLVVGYGDTQEMEMALHLLEQSQEFRLSLGKAARTAYESTYSWEIMRNRLAALYQELLGVD